MAKKMSDVTKAELELRNSVSNLMNELLKANGFDGEKASKYASYRIVSILNDYGFDINELAELQ